jgi:hypothetical protein
MSFLGSIGNAISDAVSSVGDAIGSVAKTTSSIFQPTFQGFGHIASGQIGKGLQEIAPAAAIAAATYATGGLDSLLAPTVATVAPEALAPTAASYGGVLGGGSTALTAPAAAGTLAGLGAAAAPTAASYGGVLGGGSTALTGGVAPAVGDITASGIGSVLPAATLGSTLSSLLPTTPAGLAALGSGAGSAISGLLGANAATNAAQIQADAAKAASANQLAMFNTLNTQQAPYRAQGYNALNQIGSMLPGQSIQYDAAGNPVGTITGTGYLTQQYGPQDFAAGVDPGYMFRLQQGQMANQRAGNVSGGGLGGNVMRGLQDYTQGQASQEYNNAFNRFQTQRSNIYNTLAGIAGIGQTGQTATNTAGTNMATAASQLGVGSAAAQAAGQTGAANAYSNAINNVVNNYTLASLLNQGGRVG